MNLKKYIAQAKSSQFGLKKLNYILAIGIPFNKPHGIKLHHVSDHLVETIIPYKRKNFNHIKGIHACALATCSEFASGFILLSNLDDQKYRLIMERIEMDYHYQAKTTCISKAELSENWLKETIYAPLETAEKISIKMAVKTYDLNDNHICTATITWQIKAWDRVKTKL